MNIDTAAKKIWDYMLMHQELKKADVIFVLGSRDTRTAEYAAKLYLEGWAPVVLFSGSGSIHSHKPGREKFVGTTEAEVFAGVAIKAGVPKEAIILENEAQNTGDNYRFSTKKLNERGIFPKRVIAVQKPYMQRRTYATGKVHWPDVEIIVASEPVSYDEYMKDPEFKNYSINAMTGDLQRIIEYPKLGFQIPQDVPAEVVEAYEYLKSEGFTDRLIKN